MLAVAALVLPSGFVPQAGIAAYFVLIAVGWSAWLTASSLRPPPSAP